MRHSSIQYIDTEPLTGKCVIKQQEEGGTRLERVLVDMSSSLLTIGAGFG
ncbi:Uncharacterised protein [Yersinia aldovae]|nr:Uncharacterised protein [Yersinia aldovae]